MKRLIPILLLLSVFGACSGGNPPADSGMDAVEPADSFMDADVAVDDVTARDDGVADTWTDTAIDAHAPDADATDPVDGWLNDNGDVAHLDAASDVDDVTPGDVLENVPGTVVYWRVSPEFQIFGPDLIYTASPSIVVLPNGDYLISFNLFGSALEPSAEVSGTTYIYRSSDKGETWTCLTPEPMMDMKRGSLFVHGDAVYLWGYTAAPGRVVIRKSDDNGSTWTTPADADTGLLTENDLGGTPHNPAFFDGRIWTAVSGKSLMSVPQDADLLSASAWSGPSASANTNGGPLGDDLVITEAQIVAAPHTGVVLLPKIGGLPFTVLIRASGNATVKTPDVVDWVALPGGEKKFGAGYDPISMKFWVVSNPVLPAHANHPTQGPQLIRNTAALLASDDLTQWEVRQLFLYSPNVDHEAFQYLNFDIDGDDMIVASRTAFDITPLGLFKPPRGHESNMITFHRIPGFRTAVPEHYLIVSEGEVLRYERTQHADAPLGLFILGSSFEGLPLDDVTGLADGGDGTVLAREAQGRTLRFDLAGNFMGVATGPTASPDAETIYIDQPPEGARIWVTAAGGDWADLENWYYWGRPDNGMEDAHFGSAATDPALVQVDQEFRVRGIRFSGPAGYEITGTGSLHVEPVTGPGSLEVTAGIHKIDVPVRMGGTIEANIATGSELFLSAGLAMDGATVNISGAGRLPVAGSFNMGAGTLIVDGNGTLSIAAGTTCDIAAGTILFIPPEGTEFSISATFPLISGAANLGATFGSVILPDPGEGKAWDQSRLYVDGTVRIVAD